MARNTKPKTDNKTAVQETQEGTQGTHETQEGQEAPKPDPDVTVTVDYEAGLNLRDGPHRDYNSLAILPNGTALTVLVLPEGAEVPGWALIRCVVDDEPLVGWICTDFVREDGHGQRGAAEGR